MLCQKVSHKKGNLLPETLHQKKLKVLSNHTNEHFYIHTLTLLQRIAKTFNEHLKQQKCMFQMQIIAT